MALYVNNIRVDTEKMAPDMTLLQYLRQHQQLTGTKEGCASGDCGACTVMAIDSNKGMQDAKAINSCISPLSSLDRHHIITIEGLADATFHPVQEKMVECHGSQCGFCTPGFVMSMATLHTSRTDLSTAPTKEQRAAVLDAISGNLCRCTGYRPIIEAGCQSLQKPAQTNKFLHNNEPDAPLSSAISVQKTDQFYVKPTTELELQGILTEHPDAQIIAGGTDLMLEVTQKYKSLPKLIDVTSIGTLNQVQHTPTSLLIGAAACYSHIETELTHVSPSFKELLQRLGSRQIRNRGTIGGNICNASPIADTPPILMVLNAILHLTNHQGQQRSVNINDFYQGYKKTVLQAGEYLAHIEIPLSALHQPIKLYKVSKRYEDDISAVMGAFTLTQDGAIRMAFGGMAATPVRAVQTESILTLDENNQFSAASLDQARACLSREFSPISDVRASAEYRSEMASNLLVKACLELTSNISIGAFEHA
ncbi:xanthine dehydrogenase small subunit [Echinimonas agarilytica]|uniref:Xanthine dehydrogenase small subunit n=1 Tax=Echinimonas agarilytica TaxID=1215918 RepID=A0AA42B7X7_9GAMM|nr:xanthine dehydrogenase small subunit [Echinimonas agarilytica]MCM2680214.1 xanthine dehydrogenase small subunit [Echinimonas agarilytica]